MQLYLLAPKLQQLIRWLLLQLIYVSYLKVQLEAILKILLENYGFDHILHFDYTDLS